MNHSIKSIALFLALLVLTPSFVLAETVVRVDDSVSVAEDQVVENDFYAAAGTVSVSGTISGDMYAVGATVTVNGPIEADLTVLSGNVQVHAPVADDVRVVAGEVVIADTVGGDVFVLGGLLKVLSSATIEGDVFFYGGDAEINGSVTGSVVGVAEAFRIDAAVGGDIDVTAASLSLGDRAAIAGGVTYVSPRELKRSASATIVGEIIHTKDVNDQSNDAKNFPVIQIMVSLFATLCVYMLFAAQLRTFTGTVFAQYGKFGLIGLGVLVLMPIASIFLMITVLGFLVGLCGLLAFMLMCIISAVLLPVLTGALIAKVVTKQMTVSLPWILLGVIALQIVVLVPIIGPFILFTLFLITLGAIAYQLYHFVS